MGMNGWPRRSVLLVLVVLAAASFAPGIPPAAADWDSGQAAYERGDIAAAIEAWRPLAEAGDARAQAAIGSLYIHGQGVSVDYAEALRWTRRAAEQGDVTGQFNMGTIYAGGLGVERDYAVSGGVVRSRRRAGRRGQPLQPRRALRARLGRDEGR